jgi:hypothetical protein
VRIFQEQLAHPSQASQVRVNVFEQPEGGWLVTEDRTGTATVVKTLGLFDEREAALAAARRHVEGLARQRYRPLTSAA